MATKRHVLVPLFALTVLICASAGAAAQGIGVAIKGGPVYPDFRITEPIASVDVDNRVGWQAGIALGGNRPGLFGGQVEVNYMVKRAAVTDPLGGTGRVKLDYIQVPVLARLNLGTKSKNIFAIYFIGGPTFDMKVHQDTSGFLVPPPDDSFKNFDMSIMAGGGVEITRLIIEGRYAWGLLQVNNNFESAAELKVNTFALLFGLRFY